MCALIVFHEARAISPSCSSVLLCLRWAPLPLPLECDGLLAACSVIADELNVCVFVEVWVGVELEGDKVLDFFCGRSCDVCEAIDDRVDNCLSIVWARWC